MSIEPPYAGPTHGACEESSGENPASPDLAISRSGFLTVHVRRDCVSSEHTLTTNIKKSLLSGLL